MENEGKGLLARFGVPVPIGRLVSRREELADVVLPAMVKAQMRMGGRGKAGAIVRATTRAQLVAGPTGCSVLRSRGIASILC